MSGVIPVILDSILSWIVFIVVSVQLMIRLIIVSLFPSGVWPLRYILQRVEFIDCSFELVVVLLELPDLELSYLSLEFRECSCVYVGT